MRHHWLVFAAMSLLAGVPAYGAGGADYRLNEGAGTVAQDSSGAGNNGAISGAQYVAGHAGTGLRFTAGSLDRVTLPVSYLNGFTNTAYFEAWVNPSSYPSGPFGCDVTIFRKRAPFNDWQVSLVGNGLLNCNLDGVGGNGGSVPLNEWSKVACWYDGAAMHALVNGVEVANQPGVVSPDWLAGYLTTEIGNDTSDAGINCGDYSFHGDIDSVVVATTPPPGIGSNGLVAHWPLDNNGVDVSGNENDLTLVGTASANDRNGAAGHAVALDPATSGLWLPDGPAADLTQQFTWAGWVRFGRIGSQADVFAQKSSGVANAETLFYADTYAWDGSHPNYNQIRFFVANGTNNFGFEHAGPILQNDAWYHIALVYDGPHQTMKVYVNGVLTDSLTNTGAGGINDVPSSFYNVNALWTMGRLPDTNVTGTMSGALDDVWWWARALSASEIAQLAGVAQGPVTLLATKDSFLRDGASDTNEGANERLRIQSSGKNRVLVGGFDLSGVSTVGLVRATLVLTVADIADNWGSGRTVSAHRVLAPWTEGNGWTVGGNDRGSGPGVTWACAADSQISNQATDCSPTWSGGTFAAATAAGVVHTNGMTGEVSWNVTADVVAGATNGWILTKDVESQAGKVFYYSREAAAMAGNPALGPRLVLEYQ